MSQVDDRHRSGPYALEDRMSSASATIARTGNPNHKGLPNWPAYDAEQRATMSSTTNAKSTTTHAANHDWR